MARMQINIRVGARGRGNETESTQVGGRCWRAAKIMYDR